MGKDDKNDGSGKVQSTSSDHATTTQTSAYQVQTHDYTNPVDALAVNNGANYNTQALAQQGKPTGKAPDKSTSLWRRIKNLGKAAEDIFMILESIHVEWLAGTMLGVLQLGDALELCEIITPNAGFLKSLRVDAETIKNNRVWFVLSLPALTAEFSCSDFHLGGFASEQFTSGPATIKNFSAGVSAITASAHVNFASADFNTVALHKKLPTPGLDGKAQFSTMSVQHMLLKNMSVNGSIDVPWWNNTTHTSLSFASASIDHIVIPGAPPMSIELPDGISLDAAWNIFAKPAPAAKDGTPGATPAKTAVTALLPASSTAQKTTPAAPATPVVKPAVDPTYGMPPGAELKITLSGIHGRSGTTLSDGIDGGIGYLQIAVVAANGSELASVTIHDVQLSIVDHNLAGTLGKLVISGDPSLVQSILTNEAVEPSVQPALKVVRQLGLKPAIGGTITLQNISVTGNGDAKMGTVHGDLLSHLVIPSLGTIDLQLSNFNAFASATGDVKNTLSAAMSFDRFTATFTGLDKSQLAHVELDGADASGGSKGKAKTNVKLKTLIAQGDIAGMVKEMQSAVDQAPVAVRGALQALQSLGIGASVTADNLLVVQGSKSLSYGGDIHLRVDAPPAGHIDLAITGFQGTGTTMGGFSQFHATLFGDNGKKSAEIIISGASGSITSKQGEGLHVNSIKLLTGNTDQIAAMAAAIKKSAPTLPSSIRSMLDTAASFQVDGAGSVVISGVNLHEDNKKNIKTRVDDVIANFELAGVGKVGVRLRGFSGSMSATDKSASFDEFEAQLVDKNNQKVAEFILDKSVDELATNGNFKTSADKLQFMGDAAAITQMMTGINKHLTTLPAPITKAFKSAQTYTSQYVGNTDVDVTVSNLAASQTGTKKAPVVTASGDLDLTINTANGVLAITLNGAFTDSGKTGFKLFQIVATEKSGAKSILRVDNAMIDGNVMNGNVTGGLVQKVQLSGHVENMLNVLSPETLKMLPRSVVAAVSVIDQSELQLAISNASVAVDATTKNIRTQVGDLSAQGDVSFANKQHRQYQINDASVVFHNADVVLDKTGNPVDINVDMLKVRGSVVSIDGLKSVGDVTVQTGKAHVAFVAGNPSVVEADHLVIMGAADMPGLGVDETKSAKSAISLPKPVYSTTPELGPPLKNKAQPTVPVPFVAPPATKPSTPAVAGTITASPATNTPVTDAPKSTPSPDTAALVAELAPLVQTVEIHSRTPIQAGRYGLGFKHVEVPADTTLDIDIVIHHNAIDPSATKVEMSPDIILPLGIELEGVSLKKMGNRAALHVDASGVLGTILASLANLINITRFAHVGGKTFPLDITALLTQIFGAMKKDIPDENVAAKPTTPTSSATEKSFETAPTTTTTSAPTTTNQPTVNQPTTTTATDGANKDPKLTSAWDAWKAEKDKHDHDGHARRRKREQGKDI